MRCESWDRVVALYTRNISRGGLFLRTDNPPAPGGAVLVQLGLPDGRTLDLAAQVAHVVSPERARVDGRSPGMGVVFGRLDDAQRELLDQIVRQAQSEPVVEVEAEAPPEPPPQPPEPDGGARPLEQARPPPSPPLDEESRKLLSALQAELGRLRELRPWEVLGVGADAPEDQIRSAFRVLCKRHHPDGFGGHRAAEVRAAASDCFIVIKKAYERVLALRRLPARTPAPPSAPAGPRTGARSPERTSTEPVVIGPPAPAPARPPRSFVVPPALQPGTGVHPAVPARVPTEPPPAPPAAAQPEEPAAPTAPFEPEFAPTPRSLSSEDLFGGLAGPAGRAAAPPAPTAPAAARPAATRSAGEEGLELYRAQQYGDARTRLAEALRRDPRNRPYRVAHHLSIGFELRAQNREQEARRQFESVLFLDPENADALAALRSPSTDQREQKRGFLKKLLDRE